MEILDNFVVFEGCDGSGTSTQLAILKEKLENSGGKTPLFCITHEPTSGIIGKILRSVLKGEQILQPQTLARLFAADRNEHLYSSCGIVHRCKHGELVICDRYTLSSLVYQGIECGNELPQALNLDFPAPQLLFYFDLDPKIAQERLTGRTSLDIYEYLEFQEKARKQYLFFLEKFRDAGVQVEIIDASQNTEKISEDVWRILIKMPIFSSRV